MTTQNKYLSMHEIAEIVGGKWVLPPANEYEFVKHYAMYWPEVAQVPHGTLWFAMDEPTALRGTKNTGTYGHFRDSHYLVKEFADRLQMAIVQRLVEDTSVPQLQVANPYTALIKLFQVINQRNLGRNIGITGTVGKTTVKRLLAALLGLHTTVSQTPGTANSRTAVKIAVLNS